MTRINRPDTLLTELRDVQRRLRLLEAARMRPPSTATLAAASEPDPNPAGAPAGSTAVPLLPSRPTDWPTTTSAEWERLALTWFVPGTRATRVTLILLSDVDTTGNARVLLDGQPTGETLPVTPTLSRTTVTIPVEISDSSAIAELSVEAQRTDGAGSVRVAAAIEPT
jgi:hypothetical protein